MANLSRLKWVIDSAESTIRKEIYDKRTVLGLEFNYVQGNTANSDDEVWQDLKVNYHIVKVC
jgi:hypothetical protein